MDFDLFDGWGASNVRGINSLSKVNFQSPSGVELKAKMTYSDIKKYQLTAPISEAGNDFMLNTAFWDVQETIW